jgi:Flp pilus assembly pilin Flp
MKTLARRAAGDSLLNRLLQRTAGQNIVEYALLAAVLALVVLGAIVFIGRDVSLTYGSIGSRLSGDGATAGNTGGGNGGTGGGTSSGNAGGNGAANGGADSGTNAGGNANGSGGNGGNGAGNGGTGGNSGGNKHPTGPPPPER